MTELHLNPSVLTEEQSGGLFAVFVGSEGRVLVTNDVGIEIINYFRDAEMPTVSGAVSRIHELYPDETDEKVRRDVGAFCTDAKTKSVLL